MQEPVARAELICALDVNGFNSQFSIFNFQFSILTIYHLHADRCDGLHSVAVDGVEVVIHGVPMGIETTLSAVLNDVYCGNA